MSRVIRTFVAGFFVLLPIVLTIALVIWVGGLVYDFVGPASAVGQVLISIGLGLSGSLAAPYLAGVIVVAAAIFLVGLIVESRLQRHLKGAVDRIMRRIPLVGTVYDLTKRFVAIAERKDGDTLKSMSPVWCFFGGEGGAAVLALLPSPEAISVGGELYNVVLVPSAPVPVGGCLIYVPAKWVVPADVGLEGLMSIYVSMGVTSPQRVALPLPPIQGRTAES